MLSRGVKAKKVYICEGLIGRGNKQDAACFNSKYVIMKRTLLLIFSLLSTFGFSQPVSFDTLLSRGEKEFAKEWDKQNFNVAVDNLEKAVKLRPDHSEAHYFLGYSYSRLNSKDGEGMIGMKLSWTLKASEQYELVNIFAPKYTGKSLFLDPYSKLTSEWGSLAMCYLYNNKKDSASWAFKEGRKRGGFGDFCLSLNRDVLDLCSHNAILISSGDNFTIPLWYLQTVENYRKDVTVIDISLLNASWYPRYIINNSKISFGLSKTTLDTINYRTWPDSLVSVKSKNGENFMWVIRATYYEKYILRGDWLFLNLLKENGFNRDVFFTTAFNEDYRLGLQDKLQSLILVDRINYDNADPLSFTDYKARITNVLGCLRYINKNSRDELNFVDNIRFDIFIRADHCLKTGDNKQAKELMAIIDKYADVKLYPFQSDEAQKYYEFLKQKI
jgi:hypothetical protein